MTPTLAAIYDELVEAMRVARQESSRAIQLRNAALAAQCRSASMPGDPLRPSTRDARKSRQQKPPRCAGQSAAAAGGEGAPGG